MKKLIKNAKYLYLALGVAIVIFLTQCGIEPFTLTMPASGNANEVTTFIINGRTDSRIATDQPDPTYTTRLIVGVMVPKSWNMRANGSLRLQSTKGNEATMQLVPESEAEPVSGLKWPEAAKRGFGIGPNLFDDFEWVIYRTNRAYTFVNGENIDFKVHVSAKLGPENMLVKLGFYLGSTKENLDLANTNFVKFAFSNAFEVKNGVGEIIDFVNPQLSKIEPVKSQDNDLVTFTFESGVTEHVLSNNEELYLCATAYDQNNLMIGQTCERSAKTKLSAIGGKRYRIDLWPRGFFNIAADKTISRIEYHYTDVTGTLKVGYGNTADPFKFNFKCQ